MTHAWYYVGGFSVLAWLLISIGTGFKLGKFQVHGHWLFTVLGLLAGIIAGVYATTTVIYNVTGAFVNSFDIFRLAVFLAVLVGVGFTIAAFFPDSFHGFTAGAGLVFAWVLIPSLLRHGVVPGQAGAFIQNTLHALTDPIVANTRWFG